MAELLVILLQPMQVDESSENSRVPAAHNLSILPALAFCRMARSDIFWYDAAVAEARDATRGRMSETPAGPLRREGVEALSHMEEALGLLDCCEAAFDAGAHLDLAICRLRDVLEQNGIQIAARGLRSS